MPRHRTPHPDLAGYVLGTLEPAETAAFADHLDECSACRAEVAELAALPDLLARADVAAEPPADLRRRTLTAVDAAPARTPRRVARRSIPVGVVAVAALLVAALAAAALLSRGTATPNDDVFVAELASVTTDASADGAAAHGTARLRSTPQGIVVDLEVEGLASGDGSHYECWYVDAGEGTTRISAGTFVTTADGTAKVRMITAADPVRFPRIVITREPGDGNPTPGEPVLTSLGDGDR